MHISIPVNDTMEYIDSTEISPLISKCAIKVCYVGQSANRNNTVITKEVATEMGRKLLGSPIVGYYNKESKDFEEHSRALNLEDNSFELVDITKPYGFVPTDAMVWFQSFVDDGIEHEYLCTEGYIWTGAYPESQRIIDEGNNQSMELHTKNSTGFWTNSENSHGRIFVYNEALIEKLCILGEDVEPCFEGAQIKSHFSLEEDASFQEFKNTMFAMISEIQNSLNEGGSLNTMNNEDIVKDEDLFKKNPDEDEDKNEQSKTDENDEVIEEDKKKKEDEDYACGNVDDEKKKYNLDEVVEYQELKTAHENLQSQYSALEKEIASLRTFKLETERKDKQNMIDSFYMLTDEDKKDVVDHIDTYSLDDIEAKLCVVCVRNKVNFNLDEDNDNSDKMLFSLQESVEDNDTAPDWVKAARELQNK